MLVSFFHELESAGVPVTLRQYLTLMEAMDLNLAGINGLKVPFRSIASELSGPRAD